MSHFNCLNHALWNVCWWDSKALRLKNMFLTVRSEAKRRVNNLMSVYVFTSPSFMKHSTTSYFCIIFSYSNTIYLKTYICSWITHSSTTIHRGIQQWIPTLAPKSTVHWFYGWRHEQPIQFWWNEIQFETWHVLRLGNFSRSHLCKLSCYVEKCAIERGRFDHNISPCSSEWFAKLKVSFHLYSVR